MPKLFPEELTDKDVEAVATFVQSLSTVHGAAIAGAQSAPISGGNAHDSFSRNVRHGAAIATATLCGSAAEAQNTAAPLSSLHIQPKWLAEEGSVQADYTKYVVAPYQQRSSMCG
jgi:hypothetical protein